ncbi:carboxyl transferase domain-containing protein [Neptuniibacter sp.]|uniref:carboxyl transferase domain-containing protein n=1 Tax=Neptuniibacter sp. TaxID=1962643 RepID=UPI00261D88FD|nr:carboxyl transferase domain-containing protein [Neptuniibacter sp.]MCP4596377.1 hypothetical protein [Neptuniibacter sp.]
MMLDNPNLLKAHALAFSIANQHQMFVAESSANWFVENAEQKVAIWANDSSINTGCINPELAGELSKFLDKAATEQVERIILFIDSAGVQLEQGWRSMKHTAKLIKQLLNLRIHSQITTIAVLGDSVGCFGGAYLVAASCQYTLGSKNGLCGVSGRKVIEHLDSEKDDINRLFYKAPYRLINQELFCILPEPLEERRNLLLMLEHHPLTGEELRQEYAALKTSADEDHSALATYRSRPKHKTLGFPEAEEIGCDGLLNFANQLLDYLENENSLPMFMGNCEQEFSFINEQRGFSRYLALTMKLLRYLSEQGKRVRIKVDQRGSGATFIAVSLMADTLIIEEGSCIYPLPLEAMSLFVHTTLPQGSEWR